MKIDTWIVQLCDADGVVLDRKEVPVADSQRQIEVALDPIALFGGNGPAPGRVMHVRREDGSETLFPCDRGKPIHFHRFAPRELGVTGFARSQFEPTEKFPRDWGGSYASGGRDDCEHERVFSGERFVCANPAWFWICPKCGRTDVCQFVDATVKPEPSSISLRRFAQLMEARQKSKTPPQPEG